MSKEKGEVEVEIKEEQVDFAKISVDEAFKLLQCDHHGLTSAEQQKRLAEYGPNKLPESTRIPFLVFLGYMWNPLSWAMEVAAIISIAILDYADFALIVGLLLVNSTISFVEESNADKAIKALAAALAPKAKALRDGNVQTIDAINLVPGDIIIVKFGDIVPADIKILPEEGGGSAGEELPMQVDQAALTGESLPVKKFTGDVCFSGSAIKQGERHCVVYATGINTFFGRAAALISATNNVANLQKIMSKIGGTCLGTIFVWVIIELAVQFGHYDHSCGGGEEGCPTLVNMLVIIVGGIPIAMPTVLSVTLALGAYALAKEGAIVARMSAVEEMAGMDVLCSDKTGTLTQNKLSVETQSCFPVTPGYSVQEVLKYGALSANIVTEEPIDMVLYQSCENAAEVKKEWKTTRYVPFNPTDKYTCATLVDLKTNEVIRVLKGSPQVVLNLAHNKDEIAAAVNAKIVEFANRGFRALGIAKAQGDGQDGNTKWEMLAVIPMFDPPRIDTKVTIEKCMELGIHVKMITGDHLLIGKETARVLGLGHIMFESEVLIRAKNGDKAALGNYADVTDMVEKSNGFAQVFPEHKFEIVEILQKNNHICGMTGDGVNDAPALKKADVGIAVAGATDAARGAADIVLTAEGLSAIVTAVIGARKIFQRMTTYSKYTVAMTFRICFTFGLLTVIYNWYFPTILIVLLAVFNDGAMIALAKDRCTPSRTPNSWNLKSIFIMGAVYGLYLTLTSWVLYWLATKSSWFDNHTVLFSLDDRTGTLQTFCTDYILNNLNANGVIAQPNDPAVLYYPYDQESGVDPSVTLLEQCMTEQMYVRGGMTRTLMYNHVSVSGQSLVFVVRNQGWSLIERAGTLTYVAFFLAQLGSTLISIFGFAGYPVPHEKVDQGLFVVYSGGSDILFYPSKTVPVNGSEGEATATVIGCTGYVIVAWIWAMIWYMGLDPLKWAMSWILNEDGFRDIALFKKQQMEQQAALQAATQEQPSVHGPPGLAQTSLQNPLGRTSLSRAPGTVIDTRHGAVVVVQRDHQGLARLSAPKIEPGSALARLSAPKQA